MQVFTEVGQVAQAGLVQAPHVDPDRENPDKQPVQTVAAVQFPQFAVRQGKHVLLLMKNPTLQAAHSLLAKQDAQLGTVQVSQLVP